MRGGAPGTRETDLLNPINLVQKGHAIILSGGSAFGLDAAAGVMQYLGGRNIGFDVQVTKVPIVCGSALFDLTIKWTITCILLAFFCFFYRLIGEYKHRTQGDRLHSTIQSYCTDAYGYALYVEHYFGRSGTRFFHKDSKIQTHGFHARFCCWCHDCSKLLVTARTGHRNGPTDGAHPLADSFYRIHEWRAFHETG